jgi:hypothetical protein
MRFRNALSLLTLGAFVAGLSVGCDQGTEVPLAKAPPVTPPPFQPVPKEIKQGGGTASSGHSKMDPGKSD